MTQFIEATAELDVNFTETAANIMKYFVNEKEKEETLKELRNTVLENYRITGEMKAANEIKDQLVCMDELQTEQNVKKIMNKFKQAVSKVEVNLSKDPRLLAYDRQIEDLQQATQTTSSDTMADSSMDLQLMGTDINVIDPITKTRMTNPVRNAMCGHVYDKESLIALLRKNNKTRCPVVGCGNKEYINLSQCRTDIVTKTYLEKNPA